MLRVVFVDDESNVLQGLRRATRSMRDQWEMTFLESAEAALDHFASNEVDVVVADMRMPGMDGAELLYHVKEKSPATARIILSGHSEEEAIFRSIKTAHQFLAKPCDLDVLKGTIEQIRSAQHSLGSRDMQEILGRVEQLPALPSIYTELVGASQQDDCTNSKLGAIVSKDVALTTEILHVVNSAFFGLTKEIESIDHALGLLGLDVVKAVVAGHGLFADDGNCPLDLAAVSDHSQRTAAMARIMTKHCGGTMKEGAEAFLAGMVHDIGLLVYAQMADMDPDTLRTIARSDDLALEREAIGADRYQVAAYLLELWAFPGSIVESIAALGADPAGPPTGPGWALRLGHEIVCSGRVTTGDLEEAGSGVDALVADLNREILETGRLARDLPLAS